MTLRQELITEGELLSAAHKQGFATLSEVDRAVIEPGGAIVFLAKKPPADTVRHDEVLSRLDRIAEQLQALRAPGADSQRPIS